MLGVSLPINGERVRLRVPTRDDVALLDAWEASVEAKGEYNDFGQPPKSMRETAEKGTFIADDHGKLLIERLADGAPLGTVDWRAVVPWAAARVAGVGSRDLARARGARKRIRRGGAAAGRPLPFRDDHH